MMNKRKRDDGTFLPQMGVLLPVEGWAIPEFAGLLRGGCRPGCRWWALIAHVVGVVDVLGGVGGGYWARVSPEKGAKLSRQQKISETFPCYLRSVLVHVEIVYSYTDSSINAKTNNDFPTANCRQSHEICNMQAWSFAKSGQKFEPHTFRSFFVCV